MVATIGDSGKLFVPPVFQIKKKLIMWHSLWMEISSRAGIRPYITRADISLSPKVLVKVLALPFWLRMVSSIGNSWLMTPLNGCKWMTVLFPLKFCVYCNGKVIAKLCTVITQKIFLTIILLSSLWKYEWTISNAIKYFYRWSFCRTDYHVNAPPTKLICFKLLTGDKF